MTVKLFLLRSLTPDPIVAVVGLCLSVGIFGASVMADSPAATTQLKVVPGDKESGWQIFEGDDLVAGYVFDAGGKPIIYPLVSPGGLALTRDFPMKPASKFEKSDHDHHRSLWLTHGEVNGIDFWLDDEDKGCGKIMHRGGSVDESPAGDAVSIATKKDWVSPEGKRVLSDDRKFTFRNVGGRRVIDCDFQLHATDGDVHFGDTKEGSFGMRVAGTMKVDAKLGGQVTNAEGLTDKKAWGQQSAWVDYTGPALPLGVGEADKDAMKTTGVTIHYHPSSFGFPCRWHSRTYGLFAANPFGVYHFVGGKKTDGHTLPNGESLKISVRLVLHDGDFDAEQTKKDFEAYSATKR